MYKAHKFRIYPTREQQHLLAKAMGCVRWYWNWSLNLCQQVYYETKKLPKNSEIKGALPTLKKEYPWLKSDVYSQCLQSVALNLFTAYNNFFSGRAKPPKFKSKKGRQSLIFPQHVTREGDYLKIPKLGLISCRIHRPITGKIKTVTLSKNPDGKYYASILTEMVGEHPQPRADGKAVGIDLGILDFAITSDSEKIANPKHFIKRQRNLKHKQRHHSRKQKGSNNRDKSRKKVARIHAKISRCREDFLHKLSRRIVNENQVICVEHLNVRGMVRNKKLAKHISDCGWGMFRTMLKYKAEQAGKVCVEIDRFFPSSKTCHCCGQRIADMSLSIRSWICPKCHTVHDRDVNAAINIKNEGLRIIKEGTPFAPVGETVRPASGSLNPKKAGFVEAGSCLSIAQQ